MTARIKIMIFLTVFFLVVLHSVGAQGRMLINNNGFVVIDNSAKIVVTNNATNAITTAGTGGNLVTESEFDQLKWTIGNNTGNFVVPFTTSSGVKIPFSYTVNSGGAGSGSVLFSTYGSTNWDNSSYMPTDVTHVNNITTGTNNSDNMIDRFWIIDATGYSTKPNVVLNFTYADAEHLNTGNTIAENNLRAQRFNSSTQAWGDYLPAGTINTASNTVTAVNATAPDFYRSWTLVEITSPMPVELLSFDFTCQNDFAELVWTTMSETNNMYFTIESSDDGIVFETVQTIAGGGNSNYSLNYTVTMEANKYYKLSQTDFDGMTEELGTLYANCNDDSELVYWQALEKLNDVRISGLTEGVLSYQLYDMSGKIIANENVSVSSGTTLISLPELPNGMYTISFSNNDRVVAGKVMMVR